MTEAEIRDKLKGKHTAQQLDMLVGEVMLLSDERDRAQKQLEHERRMSQTFSEAVARHMDALATMREHMDAMRTEIDSAEREALVAAAG